MATIMVGGTTKMAFLHPGLLWLVPLAVVPLLLHLLSLRRPNQVEWPTFRFLLDVYVEQKRRNRLLELLLAILRSGFLALLVLGLSRPTFHAAGWLGNLTATGDLHVLWDASASMTQQSGRDTAFEAARQVVRQIVEQHSSARPVTVYRAATTLETMADCRTRPADDVNQILLAARCGHGAVDWLPTLRQWQDRTNDPVTTKTILIVTDCQAANWLSLLQAPGGIRPETSDSTRFVIVDTGPKQGHANRSIDAAIIDPKPCLVGVPVLLEAAVRSPTEAGKNCVVQLHCEGEEVGRGTVALEGDKPARVRFSYTPKSVGLLHGSFRLPTDDFPGDDVAHFCLRVRANLRLLLVNGKPATDPFEDEAHYFKTALANPAFQIREIQEWEIGPKTLAQADVAVLVNTGGLSEQHCQWIRDGVGDGMGLLVFPGDRIDVDALHRRLFTDDATGRTLTSVRFQAAIGDVDAAGTHERIGSCDTRHPAFAVFDAADQKPLATARLFRYHPLQVPPADSEARRSPTGSGVAILARLGSGLPILVENRFGAGTVIVAGFSLGVRWSNLPLRPDFVPLISQLLRHAADDDGMVGPASTVSETATEVALSPRVTLGVANTVDASGATRPLEFDRNGDRLTATIRPAPLGIGRVEAEVRSIRPRNIGVDPDRDPRKRESFFDAPVVTRMETGIGVNVDPTESNLSKVDYEKLRQAFPAGQLQIVADAEANDVRESGVNDFWAPILMFAAIVFVVEFLMATSNQTTIARNTAPAV